ncbi:MAG: hypothetical protein RBT45_01560 [Acholeplasmataceae bacterium]|jgi:hypothetical protein|nr:hypothetical protein [Acholeplasmataceae bacterium]
MVKKVIVETDGIIREFKGHEFAHKVRSMQRHELENEVKLFTDRTEMVNYVNQLEGIHNVEIFKIEDNLYKVLVMRKPKSEHKCCHEDENDQDIHHHEHHDHKCCKDE